MNPISRSGSIASLSRPLGEIRAAMPHDLACKVMHEIHADLTKTPIKEIEDHVAGCLNPINVAR
jgi:protein required for attachment to host cells